MSAPSRAATPRATPVGAPAVRPGPRRGAVDLTVLGVLLLLGVLGFHDVYGGLQYLVTGVVALVLGLLIAVVGARWRWGPLRLALTVVLVHLLLGTPFAAPTHGLGGVVPTPSSLLELLRAPVTTWKSVLTMAPPVGSAQGVLAAVWISVLLLALAAGTVVLRTRAYVAAWLITLLGTVVAVLLGTDQAVAPVVRGVVAAVVSVAWLTWRFESGRLAGSESTIISDTVRPGSWRNPVLRRRVIGGALVLLLSAGTAVAARDLLDPPPGTARYALRDTLTPPFDPREYVSPLSEFRGYLKNQRETTLFTATGLTGGDLVPLATLDRYDGHVFLAAGGRDPRSATGAFLRTADGVDLHEATAQQRTTTITVEGYRGVWMPTMGSRTDRIDVGGEDGSGRAGAGENLFLNRSSGTAVDASGLREGDAYTLRYEPYVEPGPEEQRTARFSDIALPEDAPVDERFAQAAEEWAGTSESDVERVRNLVRGVKDGAYFSHGIDPEDTASLSGHGSSRLLAMLEPVGFDETAADAQPLGRIGDEEQFAAFTAVLARSLGIPARVVVGFEVPAGGTGPVAVTGDDVTAWIEVHFEGIGWMRFDPTPDEDDAPVADLPTEVDKPLPQVPQPPPPPVEPPSPPPGAMSEDVAETPEETPGTETWVVVTAVAVLPPLLLALAAAGIVLAKVRRRRRHALVAAPARADGGWQEVLDLLTDLGRPPDPLRTRLETAALLDGETPGLGATPLAREADRVVFGPDDVPPAALETYWSRMLAVRGGLTAAVPWHRRLRALFSLRSFRRVRRERRGARRRERAAATSRARALREQRSRTGSPAVGPVQRLLRGRIMGGGTGSGTGRAPARGPRRSDHGEGGRG